MEHLFQAPSIPSVLQTSSQGVSAAAHFLKYKSSLRQQLVGRTPLLNEVVATLERHATDLQKDLAVVRGPDHSLKYVASSRIARGAYFCPVATWSPSFQYRIAMMRGPCVEGSVVYSKTLLRTRVSAFSYLPATCIPTPSFSRLFHQATRLCRKGLPRIRIVFGLFRAYGMQPQVLLGSVFHERSKDCSSHCC